MKFFDQEDVKNNSAIDGLVVPSRYVGLVAASLVMGSAMIFVAGYFWGKKSALETFCRTAEKDSLADQIYVALCGAGSEYKEAPTISADLDEVVEEQETVVSTQEPTLVSNAPAEPAGSPLVEGERQDQNGPDISESLAGAQDVQATHYAELIGFGSLQGAKRFLARLEKKNIDAVINKRTSKTAKGRVVTWYQVATKPFAQKDELISLVNTIKVQERLSDVRIVTQA